MEESAQNCATFDTQQKHSHINSISETMDIEVENDHYYTLKNGIVSHNTVSLLTQTTSGIEPLFLPFYKRRRKINPNDILKPLPFKKPKYSTELAEFVGIILGDGGISDRQVTITLHRITDKDYSQFVRKIIEKLFGIKAGEYCRKNGLADNIVISRTGLVSFLEMIGLVKGNKIKHQVDIPQWIKKNKNFKIACVKGLVDTDGCVIIHKYKSKGKTYCYKKLSCTSRSFPLLNSVRNILTELQIKSRVTKDNYDVRIDARKDVERYFDIISSHNPKHVMRYKK